jgi:hypothetical protein
MNRSPSLRSFAAAAAAGLALLAAPSAARAQASPLPESITVGAWTFRPLVDVRVRGEYRRHPFDAGGDQYDSPAIFAQDYQSPLPRITTTQPGVKDQYFVSERTRAGIAIDRGPITAAVTLQDARAWGAGIGLLAAPGQPTAPVFAPYEAYLDAHTRSGRRVFFRVGRQAVTWGDGRLLGANDWSYTGRSLDAARFGFQVGDFDIEMLGALLAMPGRYTPGAPSGLGALGGVGTATSALTSSGTTLREGSGAQLYGLDVTWRILPLLNVEITGLARIARDPLPSTITPANTFVIDGRLFGDYRGFRWAFEGAYELGKVASYGENRELRAFAFAARASWETALPGHLTFAAEGAYASGDKGESTGTIKRFDPILPDEHTQLSPMSLVAWSNLILGGGSLSVRPIDELTILAGYRYAALAEPGGRWSSAALTPIGAVPTNTARSLGHEIDAAFTIAPFSAARTFEIEPGYGLFIRGEGAGNILRDAGRAATLQHWAYLQLRARLP